VTAVYLQPAANAIATENVRKTLYRPIGRDAVVEAIGRRAATIETGRLEDVSDYPSAWGAKSAHLKRWREMQPGDLVVFFGGGQVFATAEVSVTIHSSHLGRLFWDDPAWEYVFLLEAVRRTHFALSDLYGHGIDRGHWFQSLTRVDGLAGERLLARCKRLG